MVPPKSRKAFHKSRNNNNKKNHPRNQKNGKRPPHQKRKFRPRKGGGQAPKGGSQGRPAPDVNEANKPDTLVPLSGVLHRAKEGHGFLRRYENSYAEAPDDAYVPAYLVQRFELRDGVSLDGQGDPEGSGRWNGRRVLWEIDTVDGGQPEQARTHPLFSTLTSIDPRERYILEGGDGDLSMRVLDFLTPIGKGQRGLIVSPPRAGKTILLQKIGQRIVESYPEDHLMVLLIDERPEEATHFKRSVDGEVLYSTSDEPAARHIQVAELVIERCKRLVEAGRNVFLLMDSLTRLGRAYNVVIKGSGRTLSGGVDSRTLEKPKAFFGAARNAEESGSLTILATALIDTGSRMDQVIFEEFKGTGNMELVLSRRLADRRIYPAVDINLSGTRKEELLVDPDELKQVWLLRRVLNQMDPLQGMTVLLDKLSKTESNAEFLRNFQLQ